MRLLANINSKTMKLQILIVLYQIQLSLKEQGFMSIMSNVMIPLSAVHLELWFPGGDNIQQTDIATSRLNRPRGQFSEDYLALTNTEYFSPIN